MAKKPDLPATVEVIPSVHQGISGVASSHAPFLYVENAPAFGHVNGMIRVTLTASRDYPVGPGQVASDHVIVAHLRMNIPAARALKSALESALLLAQPAATDTKN